MLLLSSLVLSAAVSLSSATSTPEAPAHSISEPIRLDGVLDEPIWSSVPTVGRLFQQEPTPESEPTEETEIKVLFDSDRLYFGIVCRDRDPSAIVATQLAYDSRLNVDDYLVIILDPFLDYRNGFFFEVNPAGARADGQVSNNAERRTLEWDGIWDAAARITEDGWVAEVAIPFKTLRFTPGQTTWGLNLERTIRRLNEVDRWASPRREVWLTNLSMAGRLTELEGVQQGRGLDIRPYASAGRRDGDGKLDAGIDIFKNVTPSLNAALTVNTDFAETEVDARQVNLTRFPLFFPEKRAFFLEGAGIFEVAGLPPSPRSDLVPFFSRRVGLLAGEEVPIITGVKITGRVKGFNLGFLDTFTGEVDNSEYGQVERQNLLVARVSRNLFRQSWVGGIFTHGNPSGTGSNRLFGMDARLATSTFRGDKNLSLDVYFMGTKDETLNATDYATGFKVDYPNELVDVALYAAHIGEDFNPELGFVPRTGVRKIKPVASFRPRAREIGIRRFTFGAYPVLIYDLDNRLLDYRIATVPLGFETESQERFTFNFTPELQTLDEPFEIHDDVVMPSGEYRWTQYRAEIHTANKRRWVGLFSYGWGGFFSGTRRQIRSAFVLKPSSNLRFELSFDRNDISMVAGDFFTQIYALRADFNFTPRISWANLVQYDNDSHILGFQSRFRWILKPGNDLFVVINRGWEDIDNRFRSAFDRGTVKLQYTFRL